MPDPTNASLLSVALSGIDGRRVEIRAEPHTPTR
jgi:hypothetical protein